MATTKSIMQTRAYILNRTKKLLSNILVLNESHLIFGGVKIPLVIIEKIEGGRYGEKTSINLYFLGRRYVFCFDTEYEPCDWVRQIERQQELLKYSASNLLFFKSQYLVAEFLQWANANIIFCKEGFHCQIKYDFYRETYVEEKFAVSGNEKYSPSTETDTQYIWVNCKICGGTNRITCTQCSGQRQYFNSEFNKYCDCPTCSGDGETPCRSCISGQIMEKKSFLVTRETADEFVVRRRSDTKIYQREKIICVPPDMYDIDNRVGLYQSKIESKVIVTGDKELSTNSNFTEDVRSALLSTV